MPEAHRRPRLQHRHVHPISDRAPARSSLKAQAYHRPRIVNLTLIVCAAADVALIMRVLTR